MQLKFLLLHFFPISLFHFHGKVGEIPSSEIGWSTLPMQRVANIIDYTTFDTLLSYFKNEWLWHYLIQNVYKFTTYEFSLV